MGKIFYNIIFKCMVAWSIADLLDKTLYTAHVNPVKYLNDIHEVYTNCLKHISMEDIK